MTVVSRLYEIRVYTVATFVAAGVSHRSKKTKKKDGWRMLVSLVRVVYDAPQCNVSISDVEALQPLSVHNFPANGSTTFKQQLAITRC